MPFSFDKTGLRNYYGDLAFGNTRMFSVPYSIKFSKSKNDFSISSNEINRTLESSSNKNSIKKSDSSSNNKKELSNNIISNLQPDNVINKKNENQSSEKNKIENTNNNNSNFTLRGLGENRTLTDQRDGSTHEIFESNNKLWFNKNLFFLPTVGKYEYFENNKSNSKKYGLFYNWQAASLSCPEGSRLPTADELINLFLPFGKIGYVDDDPNYKKLFGSYDKDLVAKTYDNIMNSKNINFPSISTNYESDLRTLIWSSTPVVSDKESDKDRYFAIFINTERKSVFFGAYPKSWKGYCRCIIEK